MKKIALILSAGFLVLYVNSDSAARQYELIFSTFFGGGSGEGIRDVETDSFGKVYVAGTTRSPDFPTTPGAYDERFDTRRGKTRWGYNSDIFVAKFSPEGKLVWSTVIGGPNSEEAYGLEIDSKGYVVMHGRGAAGSPITPGVYQEKFKGCGGDDPGNPHGTAQNAYICKLTTEVLTGTSPSFCRMVRTLSMGLISAMKATTGSTLTTLSSTVTAIVTHLRVRSARLSQLRPAPFRESPAEVKSIGVL
jgi:hypothetical protein